MKRPWLRTALTAVYVACTITVVVCAVRYAVRGEALPWPYVALFVVLCLGWALDKVTECLNAWSDYMEAKRWPS